MIPQELIEKALKLTGKTIGDMNLPFDAEMDDNKFLIYLLSPSFIEKYIEKTKGKMFSIYPNSVATALGNSIYEYQAGNEEPLICLLQKI